MSTIALIWTFVTHFPGDVLRCFLVAVVLVALTALLGGWLFGRGAGSRTWD